MNSYSPHSLWEPRVTATATPHPETRGDRQRGESPADNQVIPNTGSRLKKKVRGKVEFPQDRGGEGNRFKEGAV